MAIGDPISVRLPEVMGEKLKTAAKINRTTRSALIVEALSDYFPTKAEYIGFYEKDIGLEAAEKKWRDR